MKRVLILLSAVVVLVFAILLQLDMIALFNLNLSGIYDAPTSMYLLWIIPLLTNTDYEILKDSLLLIIVISDVLILTSGGLFYLGLRRDPYSTQRKYHY
jgi:hypothetical protein